MIERTESDVKQTKEFLVRNKQVKHTPGCGCRVTTYVDGWSDTQGPARIIYCPLHAAAPELSDAGRNALTFLEALGYVSGDIHDDLAAALAKAGV